MHNQIYQATVGTYALSSLPASVLNLTTKEHWMAIKRILRYLKGRTMQGGRKMILGGGAL